MFFLDILEFRIEAEEKNCLGKTVLKMWSQICEKKPMCQQNYFQKKVRKLKTKKKIKNMKTLTIFGGFWGQSQFFW